MTNEKEIYKCEICGNIVEILHEGAGQLVCCGKDMILIDNHSLDAATEKHVPVIEKNGDSVKIIIGKVKHPMNTDHFIEWIELQTKNKIYKKFLKPGEEPEANFCTTEEIIRVRAYCNLHGLWIKE